MSRWGTVKSVRMHLNRVVPGATGAPNEVEDMGRAGVRRGEGRCSLLEVMYRDKGRARGKRTKLRPGR